MKVIEPSYEILELDSREEVLKQIEKAARTCYKSEDRITDKSAEILVKSLVKRGHEAMIEFADMTVKFVCDRGVSHEVVRHRLASYAQESTRYCNYSTDKHDNQITFIRPFMFDPNSRAYVIWESAMEFAEREYLELIALGCNPQEARSVLPHSTKVELIIKMNMREWRHFFKMRAAKTAHPQIRQLVCPLLKKMKERIPELFDDIELEGE